MRWSYTPSISVSVSISTAPACSQFSNKIRTRWAGTRTITLKVSEEVRCSIFDVWGIAIAIAIVKGFILRMEWQLWVPVDRPRMNRTANGQTYQPTYHTADSNERPFHTHPSIHSFIQSIILSQERHALPSNSASFAMPNPITIRSTEMPDFSFEVGLPTLIWTVGSLTLLNIGRPIQPSVTWDSDKDKPCPTI